MKKSDNKSKLVRLWLILGCFVGITGSAFVWILSLKGYMTMHESKLVKNLIKEIITEDEKATSDSVRNIRYIKDGVYLTNDKDEIIYGSYKFIEIEDTNMECKICRFIGNNGLIGSCFFQ